VCFTLCKYTAYLAVGGFLASYLTSYFFPSSREKISQQESNRQPLHSKMGTSPLSPNSLGSSWTFGLALDLRCLWQTRHRTPSVQVLTRKRKCGESELTSKALPGVQQISITLAHGDDAFDDGGIDEPRAWSLCWLCRKQSQILIHAFSPLSSPLSLVCSGNKIHP